MVGVERVELVGSVRVAMVGKCTGVEGVEVVKGVQGRAGEDDGGSLLHPGR